MSEIEDIIAKAIRAAFMSAEDYPPPDSYLGRAVVGYLDAAGFVIVPKEPTFDMLEQARAVTATWHNIPGSQLTVNREKMRLRWRAMLSVRPT